MKRYDLFKAIEELYKELEQRLEYLDSLPKTDFVSGKIYEVLLIMDKIEEILKKEV